MSSIQAIIIIAVVILIIVVIAAMLLTNRKQLREIEVVDAALNEIENMHLENAIERLDKMDLAGESLTTLNTWRKSYVEASTKKLPKVQKLIEEAANENTSYKLFKSRKKILSKPKKLSSPPWKMLVILRQFLLNCLSPIRKIKFGMMR